ncbi:hypothetical protein PG993_005928 [Apiospora rasikravindrae]|uniref:Myb-like domain-containing protein n=1 Tax=Apiospora rasikravindrae TaxID=990691 RepID=A0ABR1TA64_9PEZI
MSDKNNKSGKSDADKVIDELREDNWLLIAIIEENQMEEKTKGWKEIAAKRGLTLAAAKQRLAKMKERYHAGTDGVVLPEPPIKRRNRRGAKQAILDDEDDGEEIDGGEDVPSAHTAHLAPPASVRARASSTHRSRAPRASQASLPAPKPTRGGKRAKPAFEEEAGDNGEDISSAPQTTANKRQKRSTRSTAKQNSSRQDDGEEKQKSSSQDDGEVKPSTKKIPVRALLFCPLHSPAHPNATRVAQMGQSSLARSRQRQERERQDRNTRQTWGLSTGERDEESEAARYAQGLDAAANLITYGSSEGPAVHGPATDNNNDGNEEAQAETSPKKKNKRTALPTLEDKRRKLAERHARQSKEKDGEDEEDE